MRKFKDSVVVSFMGVDGSGKSTYIKKIKKKLKKNFKIIKYLHLKPYLILLNKSTVNKDPHKHKERSNLLSFLVLFFWLIEYKIFFLLKNQLIIFDRYVHDLLIDKTRYRHSLSFSLTKKILNFFPEPDLWIILNISSKIAERRKKELPKSELKRQINEYIKFAKTKKNSIILNTNKNKNKNLLFIEKKIKGIF